jgi:hypothetical protein
MYCSAVKNCQRRKNFALYKTLLRLTDSLPPPPEEELLMITADERLRRVKASRGEEKGEEV